MDDSFADFVHTRASSLVRTAHLLTGDRGHAEDLVQSSLLVAYQSWGKIREPASAEAYVRTILVRRVISWRRRRWRGELPTEHVPEPGTPAEDGIVERVSLWPQVLRLPERQRAVLVLAYYEDLSEAQIAEVLGCSVGTVKSHRARGLRSLRQSYDPAAADAHGRDREEAQ